MMKDNLLFGVSRIVWTTKNRTIITRRNQELFLLLRKCKRKCNVFAAYTHKALRNLSPHQTVRCPNWEHVEGCQWTGLLTTPWGMFILCRWMQKWRMPFSMPTKARTCARKHLVTRTQCTQQGLRHMDVEHHVRFTCTRSLFVCPLSCQSNTDRYVCNKYILYFTWFFMSIHSRSMI